MHSGAQLLAQVLECQLLFPVTPLCTRTSTSPCTRTQWLYLAIEPRHPSKIVSASSSARFPRGNRFGSVLSHEQEDQLERTALASSPVVWPKLPPTLCIVNVDAVGASNIKSSSFVK